MPGTIPGERLYLHDDPDSAITANTNEAVRERHLARYRWAARSAPAGGLWLDFACGSGYGTEMLGLVADHVIGGDISMPAIEYARRHHSGEFHVSTTFDIWNYAPEPDVVVSIETLEHLPLDGQRTWIGSVAEHLAPSGTFLVACPIGVDAPSAVNPFHLHEPSLSALDELLRGHFSDVEITTQSYLSTSGPAVQALAVCRG